MEASHDKQENLLTANVARSGHPVPGAMEGERKFSAAERGYSRPLMKPRRISGGGA